MNLGCGEGEFLIRVAERYKITGTGIDNNPVCIALAHEKSQARVVSEKLSFVCQDLRSLDWKTHKADLIILTDN